jgi:hypothetical protein
MLAKVSTKSKKLQKATQNDLRQAVKTFAKLQIEIAIKQVKQGVFLF